MSLLQHIVKYALKTQKYNACKNNCNNDILNNSIFPRRNGGNFSQYNKRTKVHEYISLYFTKYFSFE